jgi:hypothetical protein
MMMMMILTTVAVATRLCDIFTSAVWKIRGLAGAVTYVKF